MRSVGLFLKIGCFGSGGWFVEGLRFGKGISGIDKLARLDFREGSI